MNMQVHAPRTDNSLAHVLAIDDDPVLREAITDYLAQHEFRVTAVADGIAMQEVIARQVVDLVVLDLKLQTEDGMALARRLRDESAIPIIMLTGRREEADRVMGLELGADDYLTKPFSPRELLARIRAVLRRASALERVIRFGDVEVDLDRRLITRRGQEVNLTRQEYNLLTYFLNNTDRALSRDAILNAVWGFESYPYTRTVDAHVVRLRQKLEPNPATPRHVLTIHGLGYRFSI